MYLSTKWITGVGSKRKGNVGKESSRIGNQHEQFVQVEKSGQVECHWRFWRAFEALKNHIEKSPLQQKSILIKGSRGMQLERLLEFIYWCCFCDILADYQ